jgi:hypothetical protein
LGTLVIVRAKTMMKPRIMGLEMLGEPVIKAF